MASETNVSKQRNTKQKQMVLSVVQAHYDHPSADQIYIEARKNDEKISRGTVYRNLNQLSESGELMHIRLPSADRFDNRLDLHYHIICKCCGAVTDAPVPYHAEDDVSVAEKTDFKIERHMMVFEGICPNCLKKNNNDKT